MSDPRLGRRTGDSTSPEPALAIVCGHQRSGTSILRRLLSSHPEVQITRELHAFERIGAARPAYLRSLRWSWWSREYTSPGHGPRWLRAARSAMFVLRFSADILRCGERTVGLECIRSGLRSAFPYARVVGDRDPEYVFRLDTLATERELKCIVIFRDCRDVVRSSIEQSRTEWKDWPLAAETDTPAKVAARWVRAIDAQEQYAPRVLAIRYEELVKAPAPIVSRLGEFLEVDPSGFRQSILRSTSIGKYRADIDPRGPRGRRSDRRGDDAAAWVSVVTPDDPWDHAVWSPKDRVRGDEGRHADREAIVHAGAPAQLAAVVGDGTHDRPFPSGDSRTR